MFLPLFQQSTGIPNDQVLLGFRNQTKEFPTWTLRSWTKGDFTVATDMWIREHAGFRGALVKLNRQLRYSLFGQIAAAPLRKRSLVIGRGDFLHENIYLVEALRGPVIPSEKMERFAQSLSRIQKLLKEQGTAFLVVAAPNKTRLYSDTLPRWAQVQIDPEHSDHRAFIEALRKQEVSVLDTMELFRTLLPEIPDLVAPHGSHWSFHGAWVAWQHAIPLINQQGVLPPIPIPKTEELIWSHPVDMDTELRAQLNLYTGRHTNAIPAAYPVVAPMLEEQKVLDVLIVGDSYGFGMLDAVARSQQCRSAQYWFYMSSLYDANPPVFDSRARRILQKGEKLGSFSSNDENGKRFLTGKNLVILVFTAFNIDKTSWGFDRMVNRLYGDPNDNPPLIEDIPLNP